MRFVALRDPGGSATRGLADAAPPGAPCARRRCGRGHRRHAGRPAPTLELSGPSAPSVQPGRPSLRGHGGGAVAKVVHPEVRSAGDTASAMLGRAEGVHVEAARAGDFREQEAGGMVCSLMRRVKRRGQARRQGDRPDSPAGLGGCRPSVHRWSRRAATCCDSGAAGRRAPRPGRDQAAREAGMSWSAIGLFVGISGEATRQRYASKVS